MQTAEQATARAGNLHGIQRQALCLREREADGSPLGQPTGDAELAAAATDAIQTLGFVARADLAQLDARAKQARQVPHERAEVDALLGGEVDRELALIPLPFGVGHLHRQVVLAHPVANRAAHVFFINTEVRGDLAVFRRSRAKNGPRGRGGLRALALRLPSSARSAPLALLLGNCA